MAKKDSQKRSRRFEIERTMSATEVADYLDAIANGLREGSVVLGDETDGFHANIGSEVDMKVEARSGRRKSRIELSLAFRAPEASAAASSDGASPVDAEQPQPTIPDEMSF